MVTDIDTSANVAIARYAPSTFPALIKNIPLRAFTGTVVDGGTSKSPVLLVETAMVVLCGAALFRVALQTPAAPVTSVVGLHRRDTRVAGGTRLSEVVSILLPAMAVIIAV